MQLSMSYNVPYTIGSFVFATSCTCFRTFKGILVHVFPANTRISPDLVKKYYGNDAPESTARPASVPRMVLQKADGSFSVVPYNLSNWRFCAYCP